MKNQKLSPVLEGIYEALVDNMNKIKQIDPIQHPTPFGSFIAGINEQIMELGDHCKTSNDAEYLLSDEKEDYDASITGLLHILAVDIDGKQIIDEKYKEILDTATVVSQVLSEAYPDEETLRLQEEEEKAEKQRIDEENRKKKEVEDKKAKELTDKQQKESEKTEVKPSNTNTDALTASILKVAMPKIEAVITEVIQMVLNKGCKGQTEIFEKKEVEQKPTETKVEKPVEATLPEMTKTPTFKKTETNTEQNKQATQENKPQQKKEEPAVQTDEQKIAACKTLREAWALCSSKQLISFNAINAQHKYKKMIDIIKKVINEPLQKEAEDHSNKLRGAVMAGDWLRGAVLLMHIGISSGTTARILLDTFITTSEKKTEKQTPAEVVEVFKQYLKRIQIRLSNVTEEDVNDLISVKAITGDEIGMEKWDAIKFVESLISMSQIDKASPKSEFIKSYLNRPKFDITVDETPGGTSKQERNKKVKNPANVEMDNKVKDIANAVTGAITENNGKKTVKRRLF